MEEDGEVFACLAHRPNLKHATHAGGRDCFSHVFPPSLFMNVMLGNACPVLCEDRQFQSFNRDWSDAGREDLNANQIPAAQQIAHHLCRIQVECDAVSLISVIRLPPTGDFSNHPPLPAYRVLASHLRTLEIEAEGEILRDRRLETDSVHPNVRVVDLAWFNFSNILWVRRIGIESKL